MPGRERHPIPSSTLGDAIRIAGEQCPAKRRLVDARTMTIAEQLARGLLEVLRRLA